MRLVGEYITAACGECRGLGWIKQPPTFGYEGGVNGTKWQPSTGHRVPCPKCKGKKVETVETKHE